MGKMTAPRDLESLKTNHPSTLQINHHPDEGPTTRTILTTIDPKSTLTTNTAGTSCTVHALDRYSDVLGEATVRKQGVFFLNLNLTGFKINSRRHLVTLLLIHGHPVQKQLM